MPAITLAEAETRVTKTPSSSNKPLTEHRNSSAETLRSFWSLWQHLQRSVTVTQKPAKQHQSQDDPYASGCSSGWGVCLCNGSGLLGLGSGRGLSWRMDEANGVLSVETIGAPDLICTYHCRSISWCLSCSSFNQSWVCNDGSSNLRARNTS